MLNDTSLLNTTQFYQKKLTPELQAREKALKDRVESIYYGRDGLVWWEQVKRTGFIQHATNPEGSDCVMFKARTTVKGNMYHMRQVCCNYNIRKEWETILYDFAAADITQDMNYLKQYYAYKCPRVMGIGADDRDFLVSQDVIFDWPEKGMMTALLASIDDERFPLMKGKVRASAHLISIVAKPGTDKDGNDTVDCCLITHVDINGLVPKMLVNFGAKSAPTQWFKDVEVAMAKFAKGEFKVKPDMIKDWKYGPMITV